MTSFDETYLTSKKSSIKFVDIARKINVSIGNRNKIILLRVPKMDMKGLSPTRLLAISLKVAAISKYCKDTNITIEIA
jgi:hypothetical protein